jgi:hypothetical protein
LSSRAVRSECGPNEVTPHRRTARASRRPTHRRQSPAVPAPAPIRDDAFYPRRGVGGRAACVAAQPRAGWPRLPSPPIRPSARTRTHGGSRTRHDDPRPASGTLPSAPPVKRRRDPPRRSAPGASYRLPGGQSAVGRDHQNRAAPRRDPKGTGCAPGHSRRPAPRDRQRPKNGAHAARTTIVAPDRIVATPAGSTPRAGPTRRAGPTTGTGPTTRTDAPAHPSITRYAGVALAPARSLSAHRWRSADRAVTPRHPGPTSIRWADPWKAASSLGRGSSLTSPSSEPT